MFLCEGSWVSGLRWPGKLTALEQQDGYLAQVEVDEVARLVGHVRSEVAANDAMPGRVVLLVELFLDECGDVLRNGNKFKLNYKFSCKGNSSRFRFFSFSAESSTNLAWGEGKMKKTHHSNIHHRPHSNSLLANSRSVCQPHEKMKTEAPHSTEAGRQDVRLWRNVKIKFIALNMGLDKTRGRLPFDLSLAKKICHPSAPPARDAR